MPAKTRSAGNLSQNPREAVIAMYICFLTNSTELELTNIQANYWWGQMHCGPSNQNVGCAMAHPAHDAAHPHDVRNSAYTDTYCCYRNNQLVSTHSLILIRYSTPTICCFFSQDHQSFIQSCCTPSSEQAPILSPNSIPPWSPRSTL